jgi:hypothetical protein
MMMNAMKRILTSDYTTGGIIIKKKKESVQDALLITPESMLCVNDGCRGALADETEDHNRPPPPSNPVANVGELMLPWAAPLITL